MNIIVLCGGISTEREVSVHTGENVCEALRQKGHNAVLLDVYFGTDNINIFEDCIKKYDIKKAVEDIKANDSLVEKCIKEGKAFFGKNVLNLCAKADIVFMAVHGEAGENGKVQATFDLLNIKYTGTGCLGSAENIKKASILAMYAGADYIKTSTGKLEPAATPEAAYVMCQAIKEYYEETGIQIGFKPAGGMKTVQDALTYYTIVKEVLGEKWLNNNMFRLGTSSLANQLLSDILGKEVKFF